MQRVFEADVGGGEFVDDSGVEVLTPELGEPASDDGLVLLGRHESSFLSVNCGSLPWWGYSAGRRAGPPECEMRAAGLQCPGGLTNCRSRASSRYRRPDGRSR